MSAFGSLAKQSKEPDIELINKKSIANVIKHSTQNSAIKRNDDVNLINLVEKKVDDKKVIFEDEKLKNIYIDLCNQRDSIPQYTRKHIELLKQIDPVFAKRHKQYVSAVISNRAPIFSYNDHSFNFTYPKRTIIRQKEGIIKLLSGEPTQPQKAFRQELTQFDSRIKKFIKSLNDLT
jgi:hypothetical protein